MVGALSPSKFECITDSQSEMTSTWSIFLDQVKAIPENVVPKSRPMMTVLSVPPPEIARKRRGVLLGPSSFSRDGPVEWEKWPTEKADFIARAHGTRDPARRRRAAWAVFAPAALGQSLLPRLWGSLCPVGLPVAAALLETIL